MKFLEVLKKTNGVWVVDRKVFNLYKKYFKNIDSNLLILLDAREEQKTLEGAMRIYRALITKNMRRNDMIISVGGGIIQDVAGFVASTLYRGTKWIFVPTTLLAQVDSCIGGKTSINFDSFKNLLGTFYAPDEVYINTKFIDSLDLKERYGGFGEIVKLQLIKTQSKKDLDLTIKCLSKNYVDLSRLIYDSLLVKKEYIEEDEFDYGLRRILNYGHCFGHALESVSNFAVPHGLAVVIGMLFANIIALKREKIDNGLFRVLSGEVFLPHIHRELLGLSCAFFDYRMLFGAMKKDKKRINSGVALVLPKKDLKLELVHNLSLDELQYGCEELKKIFGVS